MFFKTVIIVGSGDIACDCSQRLLDLNVAHSVIEVNDSPLSLLKVKCKKNNIPMINLLAYKNIDDAIICLAEENTLVISANNQYIFKNSLDLENITIINFHYGLLPFYRGMNIPTWVIYNGETKSGATWHFVNKAVDAGNIISKSEFDIGVEDTALSVTRKANRIASLLFHNFIEKFLSAPYFTIENSAALNSHIYKKSQLPLDGILDIDSDEFEISRVLRAFDYGPIEYVPKLKIRFNDDFFKLVSYKIYNKQVKENNKKTLENYETIYLQKNHYDFLFFVEEYKNS